MLDEKDIKVLSKALKESFRCLSVSGYAGSYNVVNEDRAIQTFENYLTKYYINGDCSFLDKH